MAKETEISAGLWALWLVKDFAFLPQVQVFRAYAFDAADKSFCVLMLHSDWTRLRTEMSWSLWNCYTLSTVTASACLLTPAAGSSCMASGCSIVKTYRYAKSTVASEAISVTQQQVDAQVQVHHDHHHHHRHHFRWNVRVYI